MLRASDLRVRLGRVWALRGVDLVIARGEVVAIVGPNGSGKSTLVRTLAGVQKPTAGRVLLGGRPVRSLSGHERARGVGLLAQSAPTPPLTTVREHVGLGRFGRRRGRWTARDERAVRRAIALCEVQHLADRRLEELSGGERQRVRLATLLAQDPRAMLLDEPLAGLDIAHQLGLLDVLGAVGNRPGRAVVCVLHDLDLALRCFTRLVVMDAGRVAADGPPADVLGPDVLAGVFGVRGRVELAGGGVPVVVCEGRSARGAAVSPVGVGR